MLRKLVLAIAMALGLGGGMAAIQPAEAAVMQVGAASGAVQTLDKTAPVTTQIRYGYGYGYYPVHRYYRPVYRCRWVYRRIYRPYYGWVVVKRRVCRY